MVIYMSHPHVILAVSGYSNSGKDESLRILTTIGEGGSPILQTGLADPMKRHIADLYNFSELQMFGPSLNRNIGDIRYPKNEYLNIAMYGDVWGYEKNGIIHYVKEGDPQYWLSPREALQEYGELMNDLHINSWISKAVNDQIHITQNDLLYTRMGGISNEKKEYDRPLFTCFADIRHKHEIQYLLKAESSTLHPRLIRIKRKGIDKPPFNHRSELEQLEIPDNVFDFIILNDSTIDELHRKMNFIKKLLESDSTRKSTVII